MEPGVPRAAKPPGGLPPVCPCGERHAAARVLGSFSQARCVPPLRTLKTNWSVDTASVSRRRAGDDGCQGRPTAAVSRFVVVRGQFGAFQRGRGLNVLIPNRAPQAQWLAEQREEWGCRLRIPGLAGQPHTVLQWDIITTLQCPDPFAARCLQARRHRG